MGLNDELEKKKPKIEKAYEDYNKVKDIGETTTKKTIGFFEKYWEQVTAVIMAFILIGIQQFAEANFDPLFFLKPKFWYDYIPYVLAIWIIITSTVSGNRKWLSEIHTIYVKTTNEIQEHVDRDRKAPYIYKGAKEMDKERRINAWKNKISNKIDKLRRKSKLTSTEALKDFVNDTEKTLNLKWRKISRTKKRREKFIELFGYLKDDYIKENFDILNVRYNKVTESVLISGVKPHMGDYDDSDFQEHQARELFNEFGIGFIITSLLSAVIIALDLQQKSANVTTWIVFSFKALMLYTYYFRANARSKPIFEKTTLKALIERRSTLDKIYEKQKGELEKV